MPRFQGYLDSIADGKQNHALRVQLMQTIEAETKRKLIVYATDIKKGSANTPPTIEPDDMFGFSDLAEGLEGEPLDVFVRSPGGTVEAVEPIVNMLRGNFQDIRFIVPDMAMSAATLMCLSGNSILMDERSYLGPIDPQIEVPTPNGRMRFPAQVILDGFQKAQDEIVKDEKALRVFLPWLTQYGPFVEICNNAISLSIELATKWLEQYMFAGHEDAHERAQAIAQYLSDHKLHKSHGRPIAIQDAVGKGLQITDLRGQPTLRNAVHGLWAAIHLYFTRSAVVKVFESAHGVAWGRHEISQQVQIPLPSPFQPVGVPPRSQQPPKEVPSGRGPRPKKHGRKR